MPGTKQTVKSVIFTHDDKYRKIKMVEIIENRGLLDEESKQFILKGTRS